MNWSRDHLERSECTIVGNFILISLCGPYGRIQSQPNYHKHNVASAGIEYSFSTTFE